MEDGCHYGFYGGSQGGGIPNSQMFPLHSPSIYTPAPQFAPPHYQNYQNPINYNINYSGTFFPLSASNQISSSSGWIGSLNETGVSITPSFPMDQNSMLFDRTQCTNWQQLMRNSFPDNPYIDFNKQVNDLNPPKQISNGGSKKSKKNEARGQWTKEEDRKLLELYNQLGDNWAGIAENMRSRNGKQCRERYLNYLDPDIKNDVWSESEEKIIVKAHMKFGRNSWVKIAKLLPGRTENQLKNHWYSIKRRKTSRKNKSKKKEPENGYRKPTVLNDYIHGTGSTSTSNTTNPTTSTTIVASDEPPVDSYLSDSPSFDHVIIPPCDDEMDMIMETLFRDITSTDAQPEANTFSDQSLIQDLQPESDPIIMSPLGFNGNSEYGSSSSLFPIDDTFNIYQNNEYSQTDIQVSPHDYSSYFVETPAFSNSFDPLYDYGYMNMDGGFNADQGGGIFGQ